MSRTVLVIDLETTSVDPDVAKILEVGLVSLDLDTKQITPVMDTLVQPACPEAQWLGCWFMQNAKLDPDLIRKAPSFESIKLDLQARLDAEPVTAFNRAYDIRVLYRHDVWAPKRAPCLMLAATPILRPPGFHSDYKFPKLSEAWAWYFRHEPFQETHRAGFDAVHEARLAATMYAHGHWKFDVKHFARAGQASSLQPAQPAQSRLV